MSIILSERVKQIKPSGIRKFFDLLEERPKAISLGIGEPDFKTPWHIRDSGIASLEKGFTKYTPNAGLSMLRAEASNYMQRRFDLQYDPKSEILVTVGGSEAIDLCVRAVIDPGDEVLIPEPCFVAYEPIVIMAGGIPVPVQTFAENNFRLLPEQIQLTNKTKLLILPYPCNPTGGIMERGDLEAIAKVLPENVFVLSDEIYAELTYGKTHTSIASIDGMKERTLLVGGLSKSHSMTGWRMGFAYGNRDVIKQMTKIHQFAIMSAPTTSQYAATDALKNGDSDIARMKESYNERRLFLLDGFRKLGLDCFEPEGAFYLFPSIKSTGLTSEEFCEKLLQQEDLAVIPGSAFGKSGEGYVRACYAVSMENLEEAIRRIGKFLGN